MPTIDADPRVSRPIIAVAVLAFAHVGADAAAGAVTALLPTVRDRFQLTALAVGVLVAVFSTTTFLAQPIMGGVADRVGPRRVAIAGLVVTASLFSLVGVIENLAVLIIMIVIGGLGAAAFHPASGVIARRLLADRSAFAVSIFSAGGMAGLALGPIVVLLIATTAGLRFTPLLMIPGLALAVVLWRILPDDPAPGISSPSPTVRRSMGDGVAGITATAALSAAAATTFNAGMPLWLTQSAGYPNSSPVIGWTIAVFQFAAAGGGLAAGWVTSRVAPARLGTRTLTLALAPLALTLQLEPGTLVFFAAAGIGGALTSASVPLLIVAAQDRSRGAVASATGMIMGVAMGFGGIAFIAVGVIADAVGLRAGLLLGMSTLLPAAYLARRSLTPPDRIERREVGRDDPASAFPTSRPRPQPQATGPTTEIAA